MSVVVVSWILVLLAVFGLNYSHDMISEAGSVELEVERHQLRAWARSGVELARITLEGTPSIDCATLGLPGPENLFAFPMVCGQGNFSVGEAHAIDGKESWLPGISDEAARLPVSLADSTSLATLPGMTPSGAACILDARNSAGGNRLPPFDALAGLDASSREAAGRYLSRYGTAVNLNTAPAEVLISVGLPSRAVYKLLDWRSGGDGLAGTGDDRLFRGLGSDAEGIRSAALNSTEAATLEFLMEAGKLTVEPRYFHLAVRGWGPGYRGICEIRVVLEKLEIGVPNILEWNEKWLN